MSTIIAARVQLQSEAQEIVDQLIRAGFAPGEIASFYVNSPGQHALYPIGGDRYESPGAKESGEGAVSGAAVAGAAGVAIGAGLSPIGAAVGGMVGAHVGSLLGSLSQAKEKGAPEKHDENEENGQSLRRAGMLVAVAVDNETQQQQAVALFSTFGAFGIEQAEGEIVSANWRDFDPLSEPRYLMRAG